VATVAFSGYFPWAPASLASLIVAAAYFFFSPAGTLAQVLLLFAVSWVGVLCSDMAERELGLDAHPIVIDEVAGMIVTFFLVPLPAAPDARAGLLVTGFLLFRIFDVWKPWPADRLQGLKGGLGIMADDFMAGVYSNLLLRLGLAFGLLPWPKGGLS
jgi:phosphatidylglycerophosphatase A